MGLIDLVFYTFLVVVIIQITFYLLLFSRFSFLKPEKTVLKEVPVSVIICAKNEAENLKTFLPSIIDQEYSEFEILLINDSSKDNTLEVMEYFENLHNNVKIVDVKSTEAFWGNKKYALTLGIKASTHNHLIFTDADCKPLSKYWIKEMSARFNTKKEIILGYGAYSKIKNSFLNKVVRFETMVTAINYFSFALVGMPYMGVGRNLAYTKKAFFKANGFINHIKVKSGDDDLFVNQVANAENTAICVLKETFTESKPKTTFATWFKQKRRHVSTAKYYKPSHKVILSVLYVSGLLFWLLAILLCLNSFKWPIVLGLFLLKIIIQYIVFVPASKKLNETDLLVVLPFLEIFLIISQLIIFINNLISKPNHWK
ncbi:glycosyltransferase [Cognatitamlana onchidii]|uniref:glycosyltransferase n=1 Tax=Cognatitamlana onchidii TaxID=2562860 RepID=UPI0010A5ACF8|nr:glycosyltransferase [Algibacter onchidii]